MNYDSQRLKLLIGRATTLPPMAITVARMIEATEDEDSDLENLGKIILGDPMISAKVLRTATDKWEYSPFEGLGSVDEAVVRMGPTSIRHMATSMGLQAIFINQLETTLFDPIAFSRHSLITGLLARKLLEYYRERGLETTYTDEEILTAGVLHDLPIALLAWVAPFAYDQVHSVCKGQSNNFDEAFDHSYGGSIRDMGAGTMESWGLSPKFSNAARFADRPFDEPNEKTVFAIINFCSATADSNIAGSNGIAAAPWSSPAPQDNDVEKVIDVEQDVMDRMFDEALNELEDYLPSSIMTGKVFSIGRSE